MRGLAASHAGLADVERGKALVKIGRQAAGRFEDKHRGARRRRSELHPLFRVRQHAENRDDLSVHIDSLDERCFEPAALTRANESPPSASLHLLPARNF